MLARLTVYIAIHNQNVLAEGIAIATPTPERQSYDYDYDCKSGLRLISLYTCSITLIHKPAKLASYTYNN